MIDGIRLFPSVLISVLASVVVGAEATCNEEQINSCREAALNNGLESLRSSGDCIAKQYTEFSHLCSVKNYLPTVDYCCCRHHQDQLLCCRYHQDWNRFRCQEADDVITTRVGQNGALVDLPPLEILLPSTLIPLVCIVMCCLVCIVSCCWCRRQQKMKKNDPTAQPPAAAAGCHGNGSLFQRCGCCIGSGISGKPRGSTARADGVLDPSRSRLSAEDEEDGPWATEQLRPLAVSQLLLTSDDPSLYPCHCTPEDHQCPHHHLLLHRFYAPSPPGVEPSAPPASDCIPFSTTDYRFHGATPTTTTSYPVNDHCCACVSRPYFESGDSAAEVNGRPVVLCPACARLQPPPAYEESWTHRVV